MPVSQRHQALEPRTCFGVPPGGRRNPPESERRAGYADAALEKLWVEIFV
jgi:hypothetical protein